MPYKRDKKWVAYPHDPETGRKVHVGTFQTKRDARDAETEFLKTRRPKRLVAARVTCDGFAGRWTSDYPRPKASTNEHNAERVEKFARDFQGVYLHDIDRVTARRWALENKGRLPAVRAMFSDAMTDGLVTTNPFSQLRLPQSKGRKNIDVLTEAGLHVLADTALKQGWGDFGREYRAMLLFAGYTGVRPGELFVLRRDDLQGDLARVERAQVQRKGGWEIGRPKNGKARTIVVPPPAQDVLNDVSVKPDGWLFANPRDGKPWTQASNYYYWKPLRKDFGRPEIAWYVLRHTAATLLLERGLSPWDVSIQLGHTDGGVLVQTLYGHPSHAGARSRLLAAFGTADLTGPTAISAAERRQRTGEAR